MSTDSGIPDYRGPGSPNRTPMTYGEFRSGERCPAPVPLIGVITGLVALSGVVYTQWRADQRERERWKREREHAAAVW